MFPLNKPVLPDLGRYQKYVEAIHQRAWLTNFGPLHEELTDRLKAFLGVDHLLLVANGTLALQVAYRALGVDGDVLTTPFSFVATSSSLAWENLPPRFVDVDPGTCNLDPVLLEQADGTPSAIVPVHVYGNPCEVERIDAFGAARGIPVIYDAAHAFATRLNGRSVLNWGDASTLSFHATKLFHTVEGGAIIFRCAARYDAARELVNFGLQASGGVRPIGTNGKLSEYHAAVGLVLMDTIDEVIEKRKALAHAYKSELTNWVELQQWSAGSEDVGAYMPLFLKDEAECVAVAAALQSNGVQTRRYFHPSLNTLYPSAAGGPCPHSERLASRVLCLPMFADLGIAGALDIAERVKAALSRTSP